MDNEKSPIKKNTKFHCEICDYYCSKKSDFDKHLKTQKHISASLDKTKSPQQFRCDKCGIVYKYQSGLCRHRKVCTMVNTNNTDATASTQPVSNDFKELFIMQQQETSELKKMLLEQQEQHHKEMKDLIPQLQQVTNVNNNTTNNTNCNNKFNLNFFLNEQCKDAISIQHFIENLNIGIRELEHMGDVGYVKGMMSIFSETLGKMNIYERPLHCTDLKRDTLYIKQGDTWMKDTEDKTELKKIVETVKCRNYGSLRLWEREHPEAFECDTQDNIDYMRISSESLGGFNSTDSIKLNKIIKHVVKEVYVK